MKKLIGLFILTAGFILSVLFAASAINSVFAPVEEVKTISCFDTSALDGWCGLPKGAIRMVGAWYYEPGVLEDETGNLWDWDGELDPGASYLLWIDDCGDDIVQNDEIVKLWKEN